MDGAEEPGLVEAQLLQLLWVLCERGGKQELLQWHLRRRQTEETQTNARSSQRCGIRTSAMVAPYTDDCAQSFYQ